MFSGYARSGLSFRYPDGPELPGPGINISEESSVDFAQVIHIERTDYVLSAKTS